MDVGMLTGSISPMNFQVFTRHLTFFSLEIEECAFSAFRLLQRGVGAVNGEAAMEGQNGSQKERKVLVTFDIDGTLIRSIGSSANRLHRDAFSHAFLSVFGIENGDIDVIQHHGQTDPLVLVKTLEYYGIPLETATERLPDLKSNMIEYARQHQQEIHQGIQLLPGVVELLRTLSSRTNVAVGLVTGNLEDIAWMKMDGLGIQEHFTTPNFGGFGSDDSDRGQLVKIAAQRAEKLFSTGFDLRVHVGDTPNDIRAAEFGDALAIGVCTGIFSADELKKSSCGPAAILSDLTDQKAFLDLLGISS